MPARPFRVAVIDIGSNSIRGVVAEVALDGSHRVIDDERFQTRLGAGLTDTGAIASDRIAASIEALGTLLAVAESRGATTVRAVATAAVRTASNSDEFLSLVRERLGLDIEIVDGETEGHLAFASAAANFDLPDPACVLDIGGGSLEVVFALGGQITAVHSLPLGAVRLLAGLPADEDPPSAGALKRLRAEVRLALASEFGDTAPQIQTVIGSGGTITSLVGVAAADRGQTPVTLQGAEVSASEVAEISARLAAMRSAARARVPGLASYRADTAVPGSVVVTELMHLLGAERLVANQKGLREGILLDTIARLGRDSAPVPLRDVALRFGERCRFDVDHSAHVTGHALQIFDALAPGRPLLDARARELLEVAAILHDVGYFIGHDKHHRHSWHLLIHAPLAGLTAREVAIVAAIARYHRGSLPKTSHEAWTRIAEQDRDLVRLLAGIVRIADGLDRSQTGRVTSVSLESGPNVLTVVAHGADDLAVELYGADAKSELLARSLGTRIEIVARR